MTDDFMKVIQTGSYRERLEAIRDLLAERLLRAHPKDAAPIAKQLGDVIAELDQLESEEEGSPLDELRSERESEA